MVLINNLTIDEINAALLHLQRARTEVVGGTKGSTIQNITISNKGGGSTVDYAPTITALSNRVDKNTDDIESIEDEIDKIQTTLEQLSDNGISSMTFDPVTRQLQINTQDGEVYSCDITSENITLNFDATTNKLTLEMGEQYQEVTLPYINANEKGSANGVATLDSSGRVPYSQLPESAMEFLGNWNASTNSPHLQDGTGTNGDFYVCNVGGTVTFGTGNTQTFVPNDRVIYNGTSSQWVKLPAGQVSSVNGMSGDVTLDADDIEYSTGVTVKQKIDANAPVQADWTQTNSSLKDFIKNKIPIWITNGSADDNMSPVNVVQAGNTRPVTSGGVASAISNFNDWVVKTDANDCYYDLTTTDIRRTFFIARTGSSTTNHTPSTYRNWIIESYQSYFNTTAYILNQIAYGSNGEVYTRKAGHSSSQNQWNFESWEKVTTTADIVNSVTANNMQSVTSNAVANALENKVGSQTFIIDTTKSYIKINCPNSFSYIIVFYGTTVNGNSTEFAQGYGNAGIRYSVNKIGGTSGQRLQGGSEGNKYLYGAIDGQVATMKIILLLGEMPTVEFVNTL
jgi:hypothetical protein